MNKALAFSVTTLAVFFLMTGTLTQIPTALAHHRDGHTTGPGGGGGGGPISSTIELIQCDNEGGGAAKWIDPTVTYAIDNRAGLSSTVINAVNAGVQEWNTVGTLNGVVVPYTLVRDDTLLSDADPNTPDVTISVFNKITPGYILGASFVTCPNTTTGIVPHEIWLGVKGLKTNGVKNLAAHEMGHSIGLGHTTNNNNDLMGPSLDSTERSNLTCPSDLDVGALSLSESGTSYTDPDWHILLC